MSGKVDEYPREEIRKIAIVDSGTRVNERRLKQLRVRTSTTTFQGMTGHPDEDLSLVVLSLNRVLELDEPE